MSSVVVPCYNEAARWRAEYWEALFGLDGVDWLFVDDGSTDTTRRLLERTCESHPHRRAALLVLDRNSGKAEAVRRGLVEVLARSEGTTSVGFMDADGAFGIDDVRHIVDHPWARPGGAEAVWSSRIALAGRRIERSIWRHYVSRAVSTVVCWRDTTIPYDTQSGLKVFVVSDDFRASLSEPFRTRWMFEVELLARWRARTGRPLDVWEEPLLSWTEVAGSRITVREMFRIARELRTVKRVQAAARRTSGAAR